MKLTKQQDEAVKAMAGGTAMALAIPVMSLPNLVQVAALRGATALARIGVHGTDNLNIDDKRMIADVIKIYISKDAALDKELLQQVYDIYTAEAKRDLEETLKGFADKTTTH